MSLKSIIATPLFLVLAHAAGAAEPAPAPGSQRYVDVPPMNAVGEQTQGAAKNQSASGPQNYSVVPPGGSGEPPAPGKKIKTPSGGTKLPAVQKVRDAANRSQQADKHKGHIEVESLTLGAADSAAGRGTYHGGGLIVLGDGSVRNSAGGPKDGACAAGCSNNLTPGDGQQRGQAQTRHVGGVLVGMADGSVRNSVSPVGGNETISIGSGSTETKPGSGSDSVWMDLGTPAGRAPNAAPKGGSLGSLNGLGSIGQLAAPPGAGDAAGGQGRHRGVATVDRLQAAGGEDGTQAQSGNNMKQLGLAAHGNAGAGSATGASRFQPDGAPVRAKVSPANAATGAGAPVRATGGDSGPARAAGAVKSR